MLRRRRRKFTALLTALAMVVAACSGTGDSAETTTTESDSPGSTNNPGTTAAPDPDEPDPGSGSNAEVARIGAVGDIASLEPFRLALGNFVFFGSALDPLIISVEGGELTGGALETWEMSADYMSITMTLREGMVTHAGNPVTTEMLVANLERIQDPLLGAALYSQLAPLIAGHEVIDDLTMRLDLTAPSPQLPSLLTRWAVADPEMFVADDGTVYQANEEVELIGTGPYRLVEHRPDELLVFEAFEDFRDPDLPLTPRVEVSIFGDASTMVLALEAGEIDAAFNVPYDAAATFSQRDGFEVVGADNPPFYYALLINPEADGLGDERLRQAIDASLNRESLNQAAFAGTGAAIRECFPPTSPAHLRLPLEADVDRAEELLAEVGVPEQTFSIAVASNNPTLISMAEVISADLAAVGIQTVVDPMEVSTWNEARANGTYELYVTLGAGPVTHPARIADFSMAKLDDNILFDEAGSQPGFESYQTGFRAALESPTEAEETANWQAMNEGMLQGAWLNCLVAASLPTLVRSEVDGYSFTEIEVPMYAWMTVSED